MKPPVFLTLAAIAACTPALAKDELHHLKLHQPKPGQTVTVRIASDSSNGRITITRGASTQKGTMSVKRDRTFERSLQGTGPKTSLRYKVLVDQVVSSIELAGEKETESASGGLVGHTAFGFRDDSGRWRLFLKGGTATGKQAIELAELEAYENRRWFPKTPVAVGQTWPIDPGFIRHLTERDLGRATVEATMTLKSVGMVDKEKTAVLTFSIKTLGSSEGADGKGAGALTSLQGTIHVALDTMLDKRIVMTGTLTTTARQHGQSTTITLPVNYNVTKAVR